nr:hypothetical protein [Myxococcota bacterium]
MSIAHAGRLSCSCLLGLWIAVASSLPTATPARAQDAADAPPIPAAEPTAQERQAAADAFDRGTRAFLARDYPRAGQWFETAYRMAPAAVALIGAVRAYERGGNVQRAATLA